MSAFEPSYPSLSGGFFSVIRRDLLLAMRRPGDLLNPLFFFAMVCTLFPLAVGPDAEQLKLIGPGITWVAALLSMLLALNNLFVSDFDDGSLEQMLLSPQPLPLLALGKTVVHWLMTGLPLTLVAPLATYSYGLSVDVTLAVVLTLLPGTMILSLLGSVGAALTVGLSRSTALLSLLVLPLAMPVLIIGTSTTIMTGPIEG